MKKNSLLFIMLAGAMFSKDIFAETNELDLIILQNPKVELKKAAKKGQLEKLVRIIRLIDQKKLDLDLFKDSSLLGKTEKREIKNNRTSKKYLFFNGFLWTSFLGIGLIPAGASRGPSILIDMGDGLDYSPLVLKGLYMALCFWFLVLMDDGKALFKRDGRLVKQLIKKYHEKSLA